MKLVKTADGSHSLISDQFEVGYHSKHGAIDESIVVFISAALHKKISEGINSISILEIGFGTGLNALLSIIEGEQHPNLRIDYTAYEKYPVPEAISSQLNYIAELKNDKYASIFDRMHSCEWNHFEYISNQFTLKKVEADFNDINASGDFDIIYFDAFAPSSQEELWGEEMMLKMYTALKPGGILTTYCAKGSVKRAMKSVGFLIDELPGPTGKRQMTRAIKPSL